MKNLELTKPLAVIDIETTGLNKQKDRIVDLCITKIFPNGEKETLKSLINPAIPIPVESTNIHGIQDNDVKDKPIFNEFAQKIVDFLEDCDLCGYGIKFDLDFLEVEFKKTDINFSKDGRKVLDVMKIYQKLEPRDLGAAYLKYCGKNLENVHGAENDVRATIEVLEAQLVKHDELPRDISSLQKFCNPKDSSWIDNEGKIAWSNGKVIINFGKYQGKMLEDLFKEDGDYLRWIANADFSSEVKCIVNEAIGGKFPEFNKN
jgi:DNA polymerase-3 subunit epsilon